MVGPRQGKILDLLADGGPHSLAALINRTDPTHPQLVIASIRALARRRLIEVRGGHLKRMFEPAAGATVALTRLAADEEATL